MPERPLTVATYAVSASVAALVLGYIFGPSLFPDEEGYKSGKKKSVVGLSNPANDCFINSVLQAFAGLALFKEYLAIECQSGNSDKPDGDALAPVDSSSSDSDVVEEEKRAANASNKDRAFKNVKEEIVTHALKAKLDELCESPLYKKTISAGDFIRTLELAFNARISRQQQDAQEFLHLVAERLCEEFHARRKTSGSGGEAREEDHASAGSKEDLPNGYASSALAQAAGDGKVDTSFPGPPLTSEHHMQNQEQEFPLEGAVESQIECQTCHFKPKPNVSSFVTLTLNVPQRSTTTLDECLDGLLKVEYIDGFRCDRCRINHAIQRRAQQLALAQSQGSPDIESLESEIDLLRQALSDPENPPPDVNLSPQGSKPAPERRIAKHTRISKFPKILALHLSRSIFSQLSSSLKNSAKVEFAETLKLGGLLQRRTYRLACVVTHRGRHNSGHYETSRRQSSTNLRSETPEAAHIKEEVNAHPETNMNANTASEKEMRKKKGKKEKLHEGSKSRWWSLSDDKVRACNTVDVLSMQKEVYLLFYELVETAG